MIVLDTHVWLWWVNQDAKLKKSWLASIQQADRVGVSAISLFEVSWLVQHGRVELPCAPMDWFDRASRGSSIDIVPITPQVAFKAVGLPEYHRDPQDRIIISTALVHDALLLSADGKFKLYTELKDRLLQ